MAALLLLLVPFAIAWMGYWIVRYTSQRQADLYRSTYSLEFPKTMGEAHVLDFLRSVIGELPRPKAFAPAYALSFEKYGDSGGKRYYLHVPGHVKTKVDKLLSKKIDGVNIEPVRPVDDLVATTVWEKSLELSMKGRGAFRILSSTGASASIDANFDDLSGDEKLLMQWLVIPDGPRKATPETKDKLIDHTLFAVARLAACGEDAVQIIRN